MNNNQKKLNILIADDVVGWLVFHKTNLKIFLQNYDLQIFEFQSAHEAYKFAINTKETIDIVLTDLQMESMEKYAGVWLIENLKTIKSTKNSKYIIISSAFEIDKIATTLNVSGINKQFYQHSPLILKLKLQQLDSSLVLSP